MKNLSSIARTYYQLFDIYLASKALIICRCSEVTTGFCTSPMVKTGIARTRMFILRSCREARRVQSHFSSYPGAGEAAAAAAARYDQNKHNQEDQEWSHGEKNRDGSSSSCWVPHPRTGIYVPKGHERVMDDVPVGAASLDQTYWLRNVDGVERPDPDASSDHYMSSNLY